MKRKIIVISSYIALSIVLLFSILYGVGMWYFSKFEKIEHVKVYSPKVKEALYLNRLTRGLNYNTSVISKKPKREFKYDERKEYIYNNGGPTYYKLSQDTLYIYRTALAPEPVHFNSRIYVKQIEIPNNLESIRISETYVQLGLEKF